MNSIRPYVATFIRILIVAIFLANGFGIVNQSFPVHEMVARGVPAHLASLLTMVGRVIQIVAGLGLAVGRYPRTCAVALVMFLIPATLVAHSFWIAPSQLVQVQLVNFLKNLSMIGGLLLIASMSSEMRKAPGPIR
jgi:putative oxidoreductase